LAKSDAPEPVPAPAKLPLRPAWALTDTRDARSLQHEIASALARDPKLAHAAIQIDVTDAEVTLTGTANGVEERLQAERLVQSYAWNRRVTDHIEVLPSISAQR
jgi:osmotically-inducible protein OsmY